MGKRALQWIVAALLFSTMAAQARKWIVVDLGTQQAIAYEDGHEVMRGYVSTGRPGHRTPTGTFRVLEKALRHVSSKYPPPNGGARMDYMMRLTDYGVAMHLGYVPNYPASHGCIRLENGFAQRLYAWTPVGTRVIIRGTPPRYVDRGGSRWHAAQRSRSRKVPKKRYGGNDPLKFLSSVPGKREAFLQKKKPKSPRHVPAPKPMHPLEMLRG
ncbi:L,D-transpeptidase [Nitratifractor sp.]